MKKYGFRLLKAQISWEKLSKILNKNITEITDNLVTKDEQKLTALQVSELKKKLLNYLILSLSKQQSSIP